MGDFDFTKEETWPEAIIGLIRTAMDLVVRRQKKDEFWRGLAETGVITGRNHRYAN
jgi:hypothetical protein